MPSLKLTQLTAAISPAASTDLLYLVDATPTMHYITLANALRSVPSGTLGAPGLGLAADLDTGLYRVGANQLGVAADMLHLTARAGHTGNILNVVDNTANPLLTFEPNNTALDGIHTARFLTLGRQAHDIKVIKLAGENCPGMYISSYVDSWWLGHPCPAFEIGYNRFGYAGGREDLTEHSLSWVVEPCYWTGPATEVAECYWEYISANGLVNRRPFHTTIDTTTHGVDNTIRGKLTLTSSDGLTVLLQTAEAPAGILALATVGVRLTDTGAFQVQNAGSAPVFVVDTTNGNAYSTGKLGAGGNPVAVEAALYALRSSTGAVVYPNGAFIIVRKYDAAAWEYVTGINVEAASYAATAGNAVAVQSAVTGQLTINAANAQTNTVLNAAALTANAPALTGAGTHTITQLAGAWIYNQGNAKLANSYGLKVETQSGSAINYAIYTGTGINYLGDQARIYQPAAGGAVPPLLLSQADDDQDMIEFTGVVGVGNCIEAVGAKTLTVTHFIKVTITGVGERCLAVGTIA